MLDEFSDDEIEAVFGHEVGHVRNHHMLWYLAFLALSMATLGSSADKLMLPGFELLAGRARRLSFPASCPASLGE